MTLEIALVFCILAVAVVLFAIEKFSVDLVALMVLGALLLFRLVTVEEGISGFASPATVTVAAMFVLSAGLQKTGLVDVLGRRLMKLGKNHLLLLVLIMLPIGGISAFINNTAAVAVFLPLVLAVAAQRGVSPSKLLIPLSFASEFGGVCTLIGTSTNLLVSSISARSGYGAFSMFEMGQLGLILLVTGTLYFVLVGRFLLPDRRGQQLTERYQLGEYITELRVMEKSPLIGKTVIESKLGRQHDVSVLEILRGKKKTWAPIHEPIKANDLLIVRGRVKDLMALKDTQKLEIEPEFKLRDAALETEKLNLVEVLVAPRSRLIGNTLARLDFRRRYGCIVLAIHRRERTLREQLHNVRLRFGDALLLLGPREEFAKLRNDENFVVLEEVEEPSLRRRRVPFALGIIAAVVGLAAFTPVSITTMAIVGCLAMIFTGCLTLEEAYDAIDWRVIFLLAGVLPLGIAIEKTGAAQLIAQSALGFVGHLGWGALGVLAMIYLLTAILTECMSNNAASALLAPIAISTAVQMHLDPKPFLMAVAFAASTSFATPVGYQTNTMVYNPGGYKFRDFMKVGIPLILLFCLVSVYFIPKFWPFRNLPAQ